MRLLHAKLVSRTRLKHQIKIHLFKGKETVMPACHDMKKGEIYVCEDCGLELQVVKECEECSADDASCACTEECNFSCCGKEMAQKK
jgi:hypothetical protein